MIDQDWERWRMVQTQIADRGVRDERVLQAMRTVPREAFVADHLADQAYRDHPLPIDEGQTISQPYVVAWMAEALEPQPGDRVLEIGAGSGYAAAVLSRVVDEVYTVERFPALARQAGRRLERLGYLNVLVRAGDGTLGWPELAPYDGIVVAAGGPEVPVPLLDQLAPDGRLVIPVGPRPDLQTLVRVTRLRAGRFREEDLGAVRFVPLVGARGWSEDAWEMERAGWRR
ncbi:MAG TPA: protein-L-isoaspartate(D-aspartate) O-methyltransferase [Thermoanaerobaculia bacterium]|nr:protein-L-isoaspartate(D-aspartate) O-methyltransferase [Thermoanaerobaculia bacterium]